MPIILIVSLIVPVPTMHVAITGDLGAIFRVKEWWRLLRADIGAWAMSYLVLIGIGLIVNLVFSFDSYTRFVGGFQWPNPIAPILTLFVSRLAIGVVAWLVYRALKGLNEIVALASAGAAGALANTAFVLGFAISFGVLPVEVIPVVLPQVVFEAVLGAVVTVAVVAAYKRLAVGRGGSSV